MKRAGFTLIETLIAMMVFLLIGSVVYKAYYVLRQVGSGTSESYTLSSEVGVAVSQLRKELSETSLSSIFVSKEGDKFSFASPRNQNGEIQVHPEGSLRWERDIFYTLESSGDGNTAQLVRWSGSRTNEALRLPFPYQQDHPDPSPEKKTLVQHLLRPGREVSQVGEVSKEAKALNQVVQFVRRDKDGHRVLSSINPTSRSDRQKRGWSRGSTRLLEVNLRVLEELTSSKNSYIEVRFSVCPENF